MNLRNMMNSLLKLGSSISNNNGRSIFKEGLVNKVISKKIDGENGSKTSHSEDSGRGEI